MTFFDLSFKIMLVCYFLECYLDISSYDLTLILLSSDTVFVDTLKHAMIKLWFYKIQGPVIDISGLQYCVPVLHIQLHFY